MKFAHIVATGFALFTLSVQAQPAASGFDYQLEAHDCQRFKVLAMTTSQAVREGVKQEVVTKRLNDSSEMINSRYRASLPALQGLVQAIYEVSPPMTPEESGTVAYERCMETLVTGF